MATIADARRRAPGTCVALSDGITYYRCEGAPDGVPIILIHGATVPHWEFDEIVRPLTASGFRTLRFDLYGHGLSDRPRAEYSLARFVRQTREVIEVADFPRPAILLGHSLGAAVAAAVAVANPAWLRQLVLVAPMLDFCSTSPWSRLFRTAGVGEVAMHAFGVPVLVRRRRRRYARIGLSHLTAMFIEHVGYGGFGRALLSMMRAGTLGDQSERYRALRDIDGYPLLITGSRDTVIPPPHIARVRELLPVHRHEEVAGAEHNLLLTHPQAIVSSLIETVRRPRRALGQ